MEIFNIAGALHAAVAAVCPIDGVSIGRRDDKATWRIDFQDTATDAQKAAAQAALAALDRGTEEAKDRAKRTRAAAVESKLRELAERMADDPALLDRLAPRRA